MTIAALALAYNLSACLRTVAALERLQHAQEHKRGIGSAVVIHERHGAGKRRDLEQMCLVAASGEQK